MLDRPEIPLCRNLDENHNKIHRPAISLGRKLDENHNKIHETLIRGTIAFLGTPLRRLQTAKRLLPHTTRGHRSRPTDRTIGMRTATRPPGSALSSAFRSRPYPTSEI